ncbi:hypothetical protein MJ581_12155 [Escherichia coli]|nr:hypothetical protein MJ581_12155 [Escherichia coli]
MSSPLASEDEWQRCVDSIAAIPCYPQHDNLCGVTVPERPDIANAMALRYADQNVRR